MEKLNIAGLLKDCPKGMELDCIVLDNIVFDGIYNWVHPIKVITKDGSKSLYLTKYGCIPENKNAKCVIFPKGKTTWEGFVPPCKFKDGDVAISYEGDIHLLRTKDSSYCAYRERWNGLPKFDSTITTSVEVVRLATEEEKQELFDAIKANGYRWNAETKTLEKLVEPKFKVGNVIVDIYKKHLHCDSKSGKISQITDDKYIFDDGSHIPIQCQDNWELVPNKFDITTLKPFDKVLYRMHHNDTWFAGFYNVCIKNRIFAIGMGAIPYCIPYKGNQHLLGTTNDCDDFYKTWEK